MDQQGEKEWEFVHFFLFNYPQKLYFIGRYPTLLNKGFLKYQTDGQAKHFDNPSPVKIKQIS